MSGFRGGLTGSQPSRNNRFMVLFFRDSARVMEEEEEVREGSTHHGCLVVIFSVCLSVVSTELLEDEAAADEEEGGCFLINRGGLNSSGAPKLNPKAPQPPSVSCFLHITVSDTILRKQCNDAALREYFVILRMKLFYLLL